MERAEWRAPTEPTSRSVSQSVSQSPARKVSTYFPGCHFSHVLFKLQNKTRTNTTLFFFFFWAFRFPRLLSQQPSMGSRASLTRGAPTRALAPPPHLDRLAKNGRVVNLARPIRRRQRLGHDEAGGIKGNLPARFKQD